MVFSRASRRWGRVGLRAAVLTHAVLLRAVLCQVTVLICRVTLGGFRLCLLRLWLFGPRVGLRVPFFIRLHFPLRPRRDVVDPPAEVPLEPRPDVLDHRLRLLARRHLLGGLDRVFANLDGFIGGDLRGACTQNMTSVKSPIR